MKTIFVCIVQVSLQGHLHLHYLHYQRQDLASLFFQHHRLSLHHPYHQEYYLNHQMQQQHLKQLKTYQKHQHQLYHCYPTSLKVLLVLCDHRCLPLLPFHFLREWLRIRNERFFPLLKSLLIYCHPGSPWFTIRHDQLSLFIFLKDWSGVEITVWALSSWRWKIMTVIALVSVSRKSLHLIFLSSPGCKDVYCIVLFCEWGQSSVSFSNSIEACEIRSLK